MAQTRQRPYMFLACCVMGGALILAGRDINILDKHAQSESSRIDKLSHDVLVLQQNYQMLQDDFDSHELASAPLPQAKVDAALSKAMHELWNEPIDPPTGPIGEMLRALEASEQE